jgi:hypothetical protein
MNRFWKKEKRSSNTDKIFLEEEGIVQFCKGLGMPDALITGENVLSYFLPCFVEVYTEGDLQNHHSPPEDLRLVEWFGYHHFGEARFVSELLALRDGKRKIDGVDDVPIQRAFGVTFAYNVVEGAGPLSPFDPMATIPPLVYIEGTDVVFGGNFGQGQYRERLNRPIKSVMAFDPGVRAIHTIDQQLKLRNDTSLFQYTTINPHPFITRFFSNYVMLKARRLTGNDRLIRAWEAQEIYKHMEGDIATITHAIIEGHRQRKQPCDFLDLVIYTRLIPPRIDRASAQQALRNAYHLLRPGGALLLGFPLTEGAKEHVSMHDLIKMAPLAGFVSGRSRLHAGASSINNPKLPVYGIFFKE